LNDISEVALPLTLLQFRKEQDLAFPSAKALLKRMEGKFIFPAKMVKKLSFSSVCPYVKGTN
jgi:hypothetical protein